MNKQKLLQQKEQRRKQRVRSKIFGTKECPRLSAYRSNTSIFLQIIDDNSGVTIVSAHSKEIKSKAKKLDVAFELGKVIAKKALEKDIKKVVFDRGGNLYHGRIKSAADGAREGGLEF